MAASRATALRDIMVNQQFDCFFVTNLSNVRYLTGYSGSNGTVVVTADHMILLTDGRYAEQSAIQIAEYSASATVCVGNRLVHLDVVAATVAPTGRVAFEEGDVTVARHKDLQAHWFTNAELVGVESVIEELRCVKDHAELARIELAARIADEALYAVRPLLLSEPTEQAVALALENEMRRRGAQGPAFDTIVASGPNGAKAHHEPSERTIQIGDLVVIDFGAKVDGYRSDITRTFSIGHMSAQHHEMYDVVRIAQALGVAAVRDGIPTKDVDAACRDSITASGYGDYFTHGTGHGVGIDIHELPRVGINVPDTLATRQVVTVEPGVYLPGVGGVRIEDSVVVTAHGCRPVTNFPKDPEL